MFHLIAENPLRFIIAIIIGLATAWWIWGRLARSRVEETADYPPSLRKEYPVADDAVRRAPSPAPAPAPSPVPAPVPAAEMAGATAAGTAADTRSDKGQSAPDKPKITAAVGAPDDLTKINGIGPKLCALCNSLGVSRFDQIAVWTGAEVAEVDAHLGSFKGRIARDNWIEQARLLAAGNHAEWETRFGYKAARG